MSFYRLLDSPRLVDDNPYNRFDFDKEVRHSDRTLNYWVLGLILAGKVGLCIGEQCATVESGQFYLMPPNLRHYGTGESYFTVIYFHFMADEERCQQHDAGALPLFGNIPSHLRIAEWFDFLRTAADFGLLNSEGWNVHLASLLNQLHLETRSADSLHPTEKLVISTLDYLRNHLQQPLSQSHLSATLGYSYDHLDRLFRKRFGLTIYRRHCELRFDYAVALIQTGHSLKQTAKGVGFEDYYHFLKAFKRERGYSPGQFLKPTR